MAASNGNTDFAPRIGLYRLGQDDNASASWFGRFIGRVGTGYIERYHIFRFRFAFHSFAVSHQTVGMDGQGGLVAFNFSSRLVDTEYGLARKERCSVTAWHSESIDS
jgi:hypothetical protein